MTQHNLPATEKRVTKGLMDRKVLRRRVSQNVLEFLFLKFRLEEEHF